MTGGIVRRGGEVRRPTGPWSPAVHEYLRHLEGVGFRGAPRLVAVEEGVEVLTYLEGEVAADPGWEPGRGHRLPAAARSEGALRSVARLIRELHDASRDFHPAVTSYRFHPHPPGPGEIVCHGDLGPWNTVYRQGVAYGLIDWDACRPMNPVTDLAGAAWAYVPLVPPSRLRDTGFDPLPDLARRLRIFVDAYGLEDRRQVLPALKRAQLMGAELVKHWPVDAAGAAASLRHHAADLEWLQSAMTDLADGL
jgi:hypothetical protein